MLRRTPLRRKTRLRQVSAKRAAEQQDRGRVIDQQWPGGIAWCAVPRCGRLADDIHEPLTRARGGPITDPANMVPLCRPHHNDLTRKPDSQLGWAYDLGLLEHSWKEPPPCS